MKYPLFTLYITEEVKVHIEMDSVFEDLGCVEESSKIMKGHNDMLISVAESLAKVLIEAQEED